MILALAIAFLVADAGGDSLVGASKCFAVEPVEFARDIKPLLHDRCVKCHGGSQKKGAYSLNNRAALLAGGESGPAIVEGNAAQSELYRRVTAKDEATRMPPEGAPLTAAEIDRLKRWINEGVRWESGFAFAREFRRAPLAPRSPTIPETPTSELANPIDRFLVSYRAGHSLPKQELCSDRLFARRVSLDLVGLLPTAEQCEALESDSRPDKRARFVEQLLSQRRHYADHWLTFWNDLLRNAYRGTGFIDGGRRQLTPWLYESLYNNKPYDRFVHELVSPVAGSEGFTWGIVWRGVVNESQRREIQNAQNVGQVLLGTNLKCASCHDSFVNHWKLSEAYALASVFAEKPLTIHRCDKPTGEISRVGFLYPELGEIDPSAARPERMRRLADLLVDRRNGRLSRTVVNRLWTRMMGRGLVEPVDDMDAEPWHQDLLDFLASDLVEHHYDLKRTLWLIATSRAYQQPAIGHREQEAEYVFRGPAIRRMTAEQFVDGVRTLTGVWPTITPDLVTVDGRGQGGQLLAVAAVLRREDQPDPGLRADEKRLADRFAVAHWIWSHRDAMNAKGGETTYARKTRSVVAKPARTLALFTADNAVELFVNGKSVGKNEEWQTPAMIDLTQELRVGNNVFALRATNGGGGANPAGVIAAIVAFDAAGKLLWSDLTDATWKAAAAAPGKFAHPDFDDAAWTPAVAFADAKAAPWSIAGRVENLTPSVAGDVAKILGETRIRASLLPLDGLQSALGRPNREQVVTVRESRATMLQALELANGSLLDNLLNQGASRKRTEAIQSPEDVIDAWFQVAFSRGPTSKERSLARELMGDPVSDAGLSDLLWTIVLSPEFQLIK